MTPPQRTVEQIRRDGAADAVVLSLAHRLYRPMVTLADVGRTLGLSETELRRAVARFRMKAHGAPDPDQEPPGRRPRSDIGKYRGAHHPDANLPAPLGHKRCRACGQARPLDQFGADRKYHDGHASTCKPCAREATEVRRRDRMVAAVEASS